jgi:hypothetical protein
MDIKQLMANVQAIKNKPQVNGDPSKLDGAGTH